MSSSCPMVISYLEYARFLAVVLRFVWIWKLSENRHNYGQNECKVQTEGYVILSINEPLSTSFCQGCLVRSESGTGKFICASSWKRSCWMLGDIKIACRLCCGYCWLLLNIIDMFLGIVAVWSTLSLLGGNFNVRGIKGYLSFLFT